MEDGIVLRRAFLLRPWTGVAGMLQEQSEKENNVQFGNLITVEELAELSNDFVPKNTAARLAKEYRRLFAVG